MAYQSINISSAGDNSVILLEPGQAMVIREIILFASSSVDIQIKCPDAVFTGPMHFEAGTSLHAGEQGLTIWEVPCEEFIINLSDAVQVGGWVSYEPYTLSEFAAIRSNS
jgi:hypothetical protein